MTPLNLHKRTAATLVELLVVMSIITALAALALMLLPGIANQDNTLKGTADVQSTLKIAQGMAGSARLPRGVRFLVQPGGLQCTEMQYLEAPPVMVPDPQVLVGGRSPASYGGTNPLGDNGPRVEISYQVQPQGPPGSSPLPGTIINRQCIVKGLTLDQVSQVTNGATLILPTLGAFTRITGVAQSPSPPGSPLYDLSLNLEVFPDALLGAGTAYRTYHFGIYGPPVPVLGEPTVQLPKGIAVDLEVSSPAGTGQNYDILFSPSGQVVLTPTNPNLNPNMAVFLWVRDTTNVSTMRPAGFTANGDWIYDRTQRQFEQGGEQQIIGIRNGFIGTAPVYWPDTTGNYNPGTGPYWNARQRLN